MTTKIWQFPAGEIGIELQNLPEDKTQPVVLELKGACSDDILRLVMERNAYHHAGYNDVRLYMPYVPYGRQDRVTAPGTSFSLEAFISLIFMQDFSRVTIVDPHSQVTTQLLELSVGRFTVVSQDSVLGSVSRFFPTFFQGPIDQTVIIAPDEGAVNRAVAAAKILGVSEVLWAEKDRDPATGAVNGITLHGDPTGKHVIVVDDICDGGRTFIELSKKLEGAASKTLFVTHGIFSKGYNEVADHFDAVYTTDSLPRREDDGVPSSVIYPLKECFTP
jgi:ribose-phosphate pyrophosphokinase